jgi:uncharacterized protein with PIN domain
VKFWDSSAVVALLVNESTHALAHREYSRDGAMTVWWGTRVECVSALARRERDGSIDSPGMRSALGQLHHLSDSWIEILPTAAVRNTAERLLRVHPLRAGHAMQLAAALIAAGDDPPSLGFVSLDQRLKDAASREGFTID